MRANAVLLAGALGAVGCQPEAPPGHPPVARIACKTSNSDANCYLLPGDTYHTEVTLDASTSGDVIDDPMAEKPLKYRWELPAGKYMLARGALTDPVIVITGEGDVPIPVKLVVTDPSGQSGSAERIVGISLR